MNATNSTSIASYQETLTNGQPILPDWVSALAIPPDHNGDILKIERDQSKIDTLQLAKFLYTENILDRRHQILDILKADPRFDRSCNHYLGPVEKLEVAVARGKRLRQLSVEHQWSDDDYQVAAELISEPDPYGLHASLFLVTLREQCADHQRETFLAKAERWEYIGCYAQTELGHGSNLRCVETKAIWNEDDKTFTIHSPSLTSSKWWIGGLGKAANHALVMAQLIVGGSSFGPHPFLVQVRNLETHEVLPNIFIGDCGPKQGYNTMDTGFMLFNSLKIPHENMLSRFSCVNSETNKYERKGSPASVYATMTYVRSIMVQRAGSALARGVTIATRYCAVRRQFADIDNPAGGELQVLDYSTVQMRLLPLLATMYALHSTGKAMIDLYNSSRDAETIEKLSDLHATSCGLKAISTTLAARGLETCRGACGGQGYSSFSGIGSWYADYLPATTWEGENYMVTQQVARYVLKSARAVLKGDAPKNDTTEVLNQYLAQKDVHMASNLMSVEDEEVVQAFAQRTAYLAFAALKQIDENRRSWNTMLVDFWRLSTAHSEYLVVKSFYSTLCDPKTRQAVKPETLSMLRQLFRLFALTTVETRALDFLSTNALSLTAIEKARDEEIPRLMKVIRPHAVKLVDAWMLPDWQLDSSLGRYDGKVYEDLWKRANESNPRNDVAFEPGFECKL